MIRFAWLQFRTQFMLAVAALIGLAILLAVTGPHLAHVYDSVIRACGTGDECAIVRNDFLDHHRSLRTSLGILVIVVPGLIGLFWGAPLVAREVEAGTFRLAWTQSVTRSRWLGAKLGLIALASMVITGLMSLMVSWWASPLDRVGANRYASFDQRDIAPVGHAAFAFILGVAAGVVIRRTLPAMVVALVVLLTTQLGMTFWLRSQLLSPHHLTIPLTSGGVGYQLSESGVGLLQADPPPLPNAWIYSTDIVDNAGHSLTAAYVATTCPSAGKPVPGGGGGGPTQVPVEAQNALRDCVAKVGVSYHKLVTYQPANRYWTFQWFETGIYLAAAAALAALCFWAVRRRLS